MSSGPSHHATAVSREMGHKRLLPFAVKDPASTSCARAQDTDALIGGRVMLDFDVMLHDPRIAKLDHGKK